MKKLFLMFIPAILLIIGGCSNNSSGGNPTNPFTGGGNGGGGTGGGTGNVTFQAQVGADQQNNQYFVFTPDQSVTLDLVVINCAALNVSNEQVNGDGTTVYSNNSPIQLGPINVQLQTGQQWTFTISGKIGSANGQAYSSTVNYQVP